VALDIYIDMIGTVLLCTVKELVNSVSSGGSWVQIRQNRECDGVIEISKMIVRGHERVVKVVGI
jgi:hypothetical protein